METFGTAARSGPQERPPRLEGGGAPALARSGTTCTCSGVKNATCLGSVSRMTPTRLSKVCQRMPGPPGVSTFGPALDQWYRARTGSAGGVSFVLVLVMTAASFSGAGTRVEGKWGAGGGRSGGCSLGTRSESTRHTARGACRRQTRRAEVCSQSACLPPPSSSSRSASCGANCPVPFRRGSVHACLCTECTRTVDGLPEFRSSRLLFFCTASCGPGVQAGVRAFRLSDFQTFILLWKSENACQPVCRPPVGTFRLSDFQTFILLWGSLKMPSESPPDTAFRPLSDFPEQFKSLKV